MLAVWGSCSFPSVFVSLEVGKGGIPTWLVIDSSNLSFCDVARFIFTRVLIMLLESGGIFIYLLCYSFHPFLYFMRVELWFYHYL